MSTDRTPPTPLTIIEPYTVGRGAIMVMAAAGGITDDVLATLRELAEEGWLAVAPHRRPDRPRTTAAAGATSTEQTHPAAHPALGAGDTALQWLAQHDVPPDRVGVLGLGSGGAAALLLASRRHLGAVVTLAASGSINGSDNDPRSWIGMVAQLQCPWLGLFGTAEEAPQDMPQAVEDARAAAQDAGIITQLITYPSGGARFSEEPARTETTVRTLDWFDSYLR